MFEGSGLLWILGRHSGSFDGLDSKPARPDMFVDVCVDMCVDMCQCRVSHTRVSHTIPCGIDMEPP